MSRRFGNGFGSRSSGEGSCAGQIRKSTAHEQITISIAEDSCPARVLTFDDGAGGPATIFHLDAGGIRPTAISLAERLADAGYVVLLPDLFYRRGPHGPFDPKELFKDDVRAVRGSLMATTGNAIAAKDRAAFLFYLDSRADVTGDKVGAVGFCMGGGMAIEAAGTYPARFAAVASFHGGNLATDASDSPHTYAPKLKAEPRTSRLRPTTTAMRLRWRKRSSRRR